MLWVTVLSSHKIVSVLLQRLSWQEEVVIEAQQLSPRQSDNYPGWLFLIPDKQTLWPDDERNDPERPGQQNLTAFKTEGSQLTLSKWKPGELHIPHTCRTFRTHLGISLRGYYSICLVLFTIQSIWELCFSCCFSCNWYLRKCKTDEIQEAMGVFCALPAGFGLLLGCWQRVRYLVTKGGSCEIRLSQTRDQQLILYWAYCRQATMSRADKAD